MIKKFWCLFIVSLIFVDYRVIGNGKEEWEDKKIKIWLISNDHDYFDIECNAKIVCENMKRVFEELEKCWNNNGKEGAFVEFEYKKNKKDGKYKVDVKKFNQLLKSASSRLIRLPLSNLFLNCFLRGIFNPAYGGFDKDTLIKVEKEQYMNWNSFNEDELKNFAEQFVKAFKEQDDVYLLEDFRFKLKPHDIGCKIFFGGSEVEEKCFRTEWSLFNLMLSLSSDCFIHELVTGIKFNDEGGLDKDGENMLTCSLHPERDGYKEFQHTHVFIRDMKNKKNCFEFQRFIKEEKDWAFGNFFQKVKVSVNGKEEERYKFLTKEGGWDENYCISIEVEEGYKNLKKIGTDSKETGKGKGTNKDKGWNKNSKIGNGGSGGSEDGRECCCCCCESCKMERT